MAEFETCRAPSHRTFIGPEFGGKPRSERDVANLAYAEILGDPKLARLGRQVYQELRQQFEEEGSAARGQSEQEEEYRRQLESWADMLEILLEEVLLELDRIDANRRETAEEPL